MGETQRDQIKQQILTLLKCKSEKTEKINGETIKYTLGNDNAVISLLNLLYETTSNEINTFLIPNDDKESEQQIREYIRTIIKKVLPIIEFKLQSFISPKSDMERDIRNRYVEIYDNFYSLCASRSLEMFVLYMEWDLSEEDKVFTYNLNCFKGFWYYMNKMVLDGTIHNIMKRCPTGYGKTYADTMSIAFIFGVNPNADVMKVCGNPSSVTSCSTALVKTMCKKRYAKVFKYYEKFNCDKGQIFQICQIGGKQQETNLLITGSRKSQSFKCYNKEGNGNGSRSMYHFYDDITDPKKANNVAQHEYDINAYCTEWRKRKYDDNRCYEIFSGTTRSLADFMSWNCRRLGEDESNQSNHGNYTSYNELTSTAFIKVPKIDFSEDKNGVITFPKKYKLEEALKDMNDDPNLFWAMDQQEPQPLDGCPFAYENIQTYDCLPPHDKSNDEYMAVLDPARTGKNYASMPICVKIGNLHYFVDCVYQLKRTEDLLNEFIEKIKKHHITQFHIENNTSTSLKLLINKLLAQQGITYCKVTDSYTIKNKDDKICNNEASIRNNMVFPRFGLFAQGSDMGKFMKWFTGYSYMIKNTFDDAPDSIAQYSEKYIRKLEMGGKIEVIHRSRNF